MPGGCLSAVVLAMVSTASGFINNHMEAKTEFKRSCRIDGRSGWKPKVQREGSNKNQAFCRDGKLLPRLYVLGAPKCATTSFAFEMVGAGALCAGSTKEYHFFKAEVFDEAHNDPRAVEDINRRWQSGLPTCKKNVTQLAADFTPEYLAFVRHPILHAHKDANQLKPTLPQMLMSFYGASLQPLMVFVVMLREPLARMQSWWYYRGYKEGFQAEANHNLESFRGDAWHSLYGWQMEQWTQSFEYSQFVAIPFKVFTRGDSRGICRSLSKRLNFAMECHNMAEERLTSHNPQLEDDTTVEFRAKFNLHFAEDKEKLLQVLVKGYQSGMMLAGFRTFTGQFDKDLAGGETRRMSRIRGKAADMLDQETLGLNIGSRIRSTATDALDQDETFGLNIGSGTLSNYTHIKYWLEANW